MSALPTRPCPSWCADCTGWQGAEGIDGRVHRRLFPVSDAAFVEVYVDETLDGSIREQCAETPEVLEFMSVTDLRAYAAALLEAADFMSEHGIDATTSDPVRLAQFV